MMGFFIYDERLGINIPDLQRNWDDIHVDEQQILLLQWEKIRGSIPDRIKELERIIDNMQMQLSSENDFEISCRLNTEIAQHASIINDLWLWYRANQGVSQRSHL
ncbi:hypothetical protein [Peribacillus acanthi]|uniref:hypothetical protein n=1 Tax=Peribacillus acanthi TaxID=2171554 RepID=UPI000D3E5035|nr:hypothetical protein [Peribacillus acanthi]